MTTEVPRFAYESSTNRRARQLAEFDALTGSVSSLVASGASLDRATAQSALRDYTPRGARAARQIDTKCEVAKRILDSAAVRSPEVQICAQAVLPDIKRAKSSPDGDGEPGLCQSSQPAFGAALCQR